MKIKYYGSVENMFAHFTICLEPHGACICQFIYDMYSKCVHTSNCLTNEKYYNKYYNKLFKKSKHGGIEMRYYALKLIHPPYKKHRRP